MRSQIGFTLIEMLLTVFLIGLAASMVAINIGQDDDDIAKLEAQRFAALLAQLQDESTLSGLPMGLQVREVDNRYQFWELIDAWKPVEQVAVLREREVPAPIVISLELLHAVVNESRNQQSDDGDETANVLKAPNNLILVEPTGLTRPFIARFRGSKLIYNVALDNELVPVISNEER